MHDSIIEQAHRKLWAWCRARDFAGYDPFDALNSKIFQATPLKHSRVARLAWTQLIKRSPVDLHGLTHIPPQKNSKGIALFALAALADYRRTKTDTDKTLAKELLDSLLEMQSATANGTAWGYNFDWQSRNFFAPRGTPTIVPTAFAARALVEGYQAFGNHSYLNTVRRVCDFILKDLPRSLETAEEVCFSYTPDDRTRIYNASLLAAETLASVGAITGESELCEWAQRATRYAVRRQRKDGSWTYGAETSQGWVDNFHTAFVLISVSRIARSCHESTETETDVALRRGFKLWCDSFFLADGWPKYYDDRLYPVDTHAAATAIVTLCDLRDVEPKALGLAKTIALWAIQNLRDDEGFFYYQRRRLMIVRTPFMRWSQGWMLYALARLREETSASQI